jgi:stage V sporulation protein R
MQNNELKRLQKIEKRIYEIAIENGLEFCDIEFDVVPAEKMFEIMAYGIPGQIRSWKYGRDYEKTRTIYEQIGAGLPYEVVVNTNPSRAYLMKDNTIALQALIIAHVVGHVAFFNMNQYHVENDENIASRLSNASQ